MLNEFDGEGIVTSAAWRFDNNTFVRLAVYRDPQRQPKQRVVVTSGKSLETRDEPDYITARFPASMLLGRIEPGTVMRIKGYVQTRTHEQTLDDWLKSAKGPKYKVVESVPEEIRRETIRLLTEYEVVVEAIASVTLPDAERTRSPISGNRNGKKPNEKDRARRRDRRAARQAGDMTPAAPVSSDPIGFANRVAESAPAPEPVSV